MQKTRHKSKYQNLHEAIEGDRDKNDEDTGAKEVITHANPDILDEEVTS